MWGKSRMQQKGFQSITRRAFQKGEELEGFNCFITWAWIVQQLSNQPDLF